MSDLREDWEDLEDKGTRGATGPDELDLIMVFANGLLMISESESPLTAFRWPGPEPLSAEDLLAQLELPPETPVEERDFASFCDRLTTVQDWHSDAERANVARFIALRNALTSRLTHLRVYRVGSIQIHVFIIGRSAAGSLMGLRTLLIET